MKAPDSAETAPIDPDATPIPTGDDARYAIRPRNDLGAMDEALAREHLTLAEVHAWMGEHEDEGTFEIIDEADGLPACGYDMGIAGGASACDCERATCLDAEVQP